MLLSMQQTLEKNLGISPVDAFSIYDLSDTGSAQNKSSNARLNAFLASSLNKNK